MTAEGQLIADWFIELSNSRGSYCVGMAGALPEPLRYVEIEAWARLTGNRINRWGLILLRVLDAIFIEKASVRLQNETAKR